MAGHEAVIFFFVLSGFVLSIPFYRRFVPYTPWIIKRCCRIYLPYYSDVAGDVAGSLLRCNANPFLGRLVQYILSGARHRAPVLNHLLLIGSFSNAEFNPVVGPW